MKLALGTVQFGQSYGVANKAGQVPGAEAKAILEYAASNGIGMLDTAIGYGDSEQRLGEIGISDWQVVSKIPAVPEGCGDVGDWVIKSVEGSLQRLGIRRLYAVLLHKPQQLLGADGGQIYAGMQQLKESGLVQRIGVSIYDPAELDELFRGYAFDVVQAPFNLLDRRLIDSGWMSRLATKGTELHVRSIFLQGVLLMPPGDRPAKFNRWQVHWSAYDEWVRSCELTPLQACVRYSLSFPEISRVIVGVDFAHQLQEIVNSQDGVALDPPQSFRITDVDLLEPSRWNNEYGSKTKYV